MTAWSMKCSVQYNVAISYAVWIGIEIQIRQCKEVDFFRAIFGDDGRSSSLGTSVRLFWGLQHYQFSLNFRYQLPAAQGNLLFTRRRKLVLRTNHYPPTYMFIPIRIPSRKYSGNSQLKKKLKVHLCWAKGNAKASFFFDLCHCSLWTLKWVLYVTFACAQL